MNTTHKSLHELFSNIAFTIRSILLVGLTPEGNLYEQYDDTLDAQFKEQLPVIADQIPEWIPALVSEYSNMTLNGFVGGYYVTHVTIDTAYPRDYCCYNNDALVSCYLLETIVIPNYMFYHCANLTTVTMPKVTAIETYAFYNCTKLNINTFPNTITTIEASAFGNCTTLSSLTFEGTPSSISSSAFKGCTNITTINVPWAEGAVANAPWGATNATINYNYTGE